MSTVIKLSPGVTQYYKEYYITDRRNCENTKRYTSMNSTKSVHESRKGNSKAKQGALEDRALDGLPMIHATAAHL